MNWHCCAVGLRAEEDLSGVSGEPHGHPTRGLGKRPSNRWTKLGSDAESPPGKRGKTQVPGVKAANGAKLVTRSTKGGHAYKLAE